MSRVVLFDEHGPALCLRTIKRHADGTIKSGYVLNGGWNFERRNGEVMAKAGNNIVTRWPDPGYTEFAVPDDWCGDYNEIMNRAWEAHAGA